MEPLYVPDPTLLRAVAIGIALWFFLLLGLRVVRSPKEPGAGFETTEFGPETPALANLVTHDFKLRNDAVPATLLDLAARRLVEIEDRGIGRYYCRLDPGAQPANEYEAKLIGHLAELAVDGVVPAEALTTGPQDASKTWWVDFRNKVVKDAQAQGLSRDLWNGATAVILGLSGAVLVLLFLLATGFNDLERVEESTLLTFDVLALYATGGCFIATLGSKRQTDTPEGRKAAARWLGVKEAMEHSPSFGSTPPTGVIVWERHLAFATALGVATRAACALPMGAESDTEAWTATTGQWRRVLVRYPRLRPGWGRHPLVAIAIGVLGAAIGYRIVTTVRWDAFGSDSGWMGLVPQVVLLIGVVFLIRSVPQLFLGIADLFSSRDVTGQVLRCRTRWSPLPTYTQGEEPYTRYFVALDDGRSETSTAYRVGAGKYSRFRQGQKVTVTLTPRLGYVKDVNSA